jgi:hypothetical protein
MEALENDRFYVPIHTGSRKVTVVRVGSYYIPEVSDCHIVSRYLCLVVSCQRQPASFKLHHVLPLLPYLVLFLGVIEIQRQFLPKSFHNTTSSV